MQYYIRKDKHGDIQGPFEIEDLVELISTGSVSKESLASSDLGETQNRLSKYRKCDWFPFSQIPELTHLFLPPSPIVRPQPSAISPALSWMFLFTLLIQRVATKGIHFFDLLLLIMLVVGCALGCIQFFKRKMPHPN